MSYNPEIVASEIIDIFAKYEVPICSRDYIYKCVEDLVFEQKIVKLNDNLRNIVYSRSQT